MLQHLPLCHHVSATVTSHHDNDSFHNCFPAPMPDPPNWDANQLLNQTPHQGNLCQCTCHPFHSWQWQPWSPWSCHAHCPLPHTYQCCLPTLPVHPSDICCCRLLLVCWLLSSLVCQLVVRCCQLFLSLMFFMYAVAVAVLAIIGCCFCCYHQLLLQLLLLAFAVVPLLPLLVS